MDMELSANIFFCWVSSALLSAVLAFERKRSPLLYFLLALLLGPFAIPIVLLSKRKDAEKLDPIRYWYYYHEGMERYEVLSFPALLRFWKEDRIEIDGYLWTEGMPGWKKVDKLPLLQKALFMGEASLNEENYRELKQ